MIIIVSRVPFLQWVVYVLSIPMFYLYSHDENQIPLSALNEANLTSATQTLNFNPTMQLSG